MDEKNGELVIGASTGWLYARDNYWLAAHLFFLAKAGANAIEVPVTGFNDRDKRFYSLLQGESLKQADGWLYYKSIHLPDHIEADEMSNVKKLIDRHEFDMAVCHPLKRNGEYPIKFYERLVSLGISLGIENMDREKHNGVDIRELEDLIRIYGFGFVFDLQHASEHGWNYTYELIDALGDRIVHFHVSGETKGNNHSLVYQATNRDIILGVLAEVFPQAEKPIILEGKYGVAEDVVKEIKCISKALFP